MCDCEECATGDRLNMTPYDFRLQDEGTIMILHPCNDEASGWIEDHLYGEELAPTWWGGGVVIEHRYVLDILTGIESDELTVAGE
jgi:hypothetical protein